MPSLRALTLAAAILSLRLAACSARPPVDSKAPTVTVEEARPPEPSPAAAGAPAPEAPAGVDPAYPITMNLDDVEGPILMRAVAEVVKKPVNVHPDAQPLLDCTVVTVRSGRVTPSAAVRVVAAALRPKGLVVTETAAGVEVYRTPDAKPCARGR